MKGLGKRGVVSISFIELGKGVIVAILIFALLGVIVNLIKIFTGQPNQVDRASYEYLGEAVEQLDKSNKKGEKECDVAVQLTENLNIFGFNRDTEYLEVYGGSINPFGQTYRISKPSECRGKACLCLCDDQCSKIIDCKYAYDSINGFLVPEPFKGNEGLKDSNDRNAQLALVGKLGFWPGWRDLGLRLLSVELGGDGVVLVSEPKECVK